MELTREKLAVEARRWFDHAPTPATTTSVAVEGGGLHCVVVGDSDDRPPLVCVHGGPGAVSHEGLWPLAALALTGRRVVFFDQLGCGGSSPVVDLKRLEMTGYVDQVRAVIEAFAPAGCHLLGHSFGGMVVQELALADPAELRSVVLADTSSDLARYLAEGERIRSTLPPGEQVRLAGSPDQPGYAEAYQSYLDQFSCRVRPVPTALLRARAGGNPTITEVMWGRGGRTFEVTGRLRGWSCLDRLPGLRTQCTPTLVVTGEHDIASPQLAALTANAASRGRLHVVSGGSHTPWFEAPGDVMGTVAVFLAEYD